MKNIKSFTPQVVSIVLLGLAILHMPYGYYVLLKWAICGLSIYLTITADSKKETIWVWLLGINAVIYNPIIPLHLGRVIWSGLNIISIILFVANIVAAKKASATPRRVVRILTCTGDVDISETLREITQMSLGNDSLVEVTDRREVTEICEMLEEKLFDIIIPLLNNIVVPLADGENSVEGRIRETVKLVTRLKADYGIPIVALSGFKPSFNLPALLKEGGVDDFFWMPPDYAELRSALKRCLG